MANLRDRLKETTKPRLVPTTLAGVACFLRRWNEREQIEWAIECQTAAKEDFDGDKVDFYTKCKAIARSLCDEHGELVYADYVEVAEHDSDALDPVFDEVIALQSRANADAKKN